RDVAGLGGADPHAGVREVARWRQVNTIAMSRELVPEHAPIGDNVARDAGGPIDPGPHLQDVVEGFRSTYRRILHDRDLLLSTEGPLAAFLGTRVRLLLRDTASYGLIGVSAARGEALRSGAARGVALDRLSRQLYATRSAPRLWSLYRAEIAAMEELDIPHFVVRTDSTRVELPDGSLSEPCLDATPWDALRARVLSLSEADLAWQERLVEGAFAARYVDRVEDRRATGMPVPPAPDGAGGVEGQVLTADEAVGRAVLVGEQLLSTAFTGRNGSLTWIGSTLLDVEGSQVAIIGHDLYSGAAGIGFFLASLARVTGDPRWADAARAAVGDLRYAVRHYPRQLASAVGAGAGTGAGSILYGLSAIAALLDEGDLAHDVTRLVAACDDTTMTGPTPGDVMAGTAGLLLGLLAVHERTGDVDALALAARCGDHLLRTAATPGRGRLTWDGFGGAPLVSVAHGTAGGGVG
ncbi:DUF4135 domain-containing protein, partial [Nostocoides japonicum]|uniref:DUF4135 domain-containing protein n=1 Tax=Nostocoides japonicum TaxID=99481 RepID=UPI00065C04FC